MYIYIYPSNDSNKSPRNVIVLNDLYEVRFENLKVWKCFIHYANVKHLIIAEKFGRAMEMENNGKSIRTPHRRPTATTRVNNLYSIQNRWCLASCSVYDFVLPNRTAVYFFEGFVPDCTPLGVTIHFPSLEPFFPFAGDSAVYFLARRHTAGAGRFSHYRFCLPKTLR